MKQFFLKNIALVVVIVVTLVAAVYFSFLILQKRAEMDTFTKEISEMRSTIDEINSTHNPNNVAESETLINSDIEFFDKKTTEAYRHFGNPYRVALIGFIANIGSKSALTPLDEKAQKDPAFTVQKPEKQAADAENAEEEAEETDAEAPAEEKEAPAEPTEEELKIFNPKKNIVVVSMDEAKMRTILKEVYDSYMNDHKGQDSNDSDDFVIPANILEDRYSIFDAFIQKLIEPPEVVDTARAEAYKQAAVDKIAIAFDIFKNDVAKLTEENVNNNVAKQMFMDALGIPRLAPIGECKNYLDNMYEAYHQKDCIPGFKEKAVQGGATGAARVVTGKQISNEEDNYEENLNSFIYGKLNKQAPPVADMVIPIFRNFQIKEDLVRRMRDAKIRKVFAVTSKYLPGSTTDGDPDSAVLVYTYTIEIQSALDEIAAFIESMHTAYKDNRLYVLKNIKFEVLNNDIIDANALVEDHIRTLKLNDGELAEGYGAGENRNLRSAMRNNRNGAPTDGKVQSTYKPDDPKHPEYGMVLIGGKRGEINCTMTVDYYVYRGDNIIPDK